MDAGFCCRSKNRRGWGWGMEAKAIYEKPTLIIAHTIPGKGVDFMEGNYLWHGNPPGVADVPGARQSRAGENRPG